MAMCAGARHEGENGENLRLQICWPDEVVTWVHVGALHVREAWHYKLIRFYESKAKKANLPAAAVEG